jgi:hypothetical protein
MKISPINITAFEITDAHRLDPIRVFMQDFGKGQGRLIIECYGRAWSCFWPAMGSHLRTFLVQAQACYLENALHSGMRHNKHDSEYLLRIVKAVQQALGTDVAAANPPLDCSHDDLVTYIKSMKGGERVMELGYSSMLGKQGIVEIKNEQILIRWDWEEFADGSGVMTTSFTGGARRLQDIQFNDPV